MKAWISPWMKMSVQKLFINACKLGTADVEINHSQVTENLLLKRSCLFCQMGARELRARAISHLEEVSDEGIKAMAESGTVAVILPTTAYILRLASPPVRKMIDGGVIVALGTDFNPNAYCLSMVTLV